MKLNKVLVLILALIVLVSCSAQKRKAMIPELDKSYEVFDIKSFEANGGGKTVMVEKTMVVEEESQSYGWIRRKFYNGSHFCLVEKFYKSGGLKEKVFSFNDGSPVGTWYKYNESGELSEEIDTEKDYKFNTDSLLEFLSDKKIPLTQGYDQSGWSTTVYKEEMEDTGEPVWVVTWLMLPEELQELTIDGQTGEVLETKSMQYLNR